MSNTTQNQTTETNAGDAYLQNALNDLAVQQRQEEINDHHNNDLIAAGSWDLLAPRFPLPFLPVDMPATVDVRLPNLPTIAVTPQLFPNDMFKLASKDICVDYPRGLKHIFRDGETLSLMDLAETVENQISSALLHGADMVQVLSAEEWSSNEEYENDCKFVYNVDLDYDLLLAFPGVHRCIPSHLRCITEHSGPCNEGHYSAARLVTYCPPDTAAHNATAFTVLLLRKGHYYKSLPHRATKMYFMTIDCERKRYYSIYQLLSHPGQICLVKQNKFHYYGEEIYLSQASQ